MLDKATSWRWLPGGTLLALMLAPPLLYCYLARHVWDRDALIYAQVAKEIISGAPGMQDKPPLVYVAYGIPQLFVPRSYLAIGCFAGLFISATGAAYAWAFRDCFTAVLAGLLFITLFPVTNWQHYGWPSTEIFSNLFVAGVLAAGYRIYRDRKVTINLCVVAGVLATVAFHIRQNTVLCIVMPMVSIMQSEDTVRRKCLGFVAMLAGAILALALILVMILWLDDVESYFWTVFVYPRKFAAAGNINDLAQLALFCLDSPLPFIAALSACLAVRGPRDLYMVLTLTVISLAVTFSPIRPHEHYWVSTFPYIAVLIGLGLQQVESESRWFGRALIGMLAVTVLPAIVSQAYVAAQSPRYRDYQELAKLADRAAPEDGTLLVCGPMGSEAIQFASRLSAANAFEWTFLFMPPWDRLLPMPPDEIIAKYLERPPDVIVAWRNLIVRANAEYAVDAQRHDLRLLRELIKQSRYEIIDEQHGYVIAIRERK